MLIQSENLYWHAEALVGRRRIATAHATDLIFNFFLFSTSAAIVLL